MSGLTRREFMQGAAGGIAVSGVLLASANGRAAASERVRHAVIGNGNQGRKQATTFAAFEDCEVVYLCDVDPNRRARLAAELPNKDTVKQLGDFRYILDDPEIDTVSIATPDHWHTAMALMALKAGKHVYVEKPCCHNVHEGKVLLDAAAKYGKCVQHGTQSRSAPGVQAAMAFLRDGGIGKVRLGKAINHQFRGPVGRAQVEDPPPGVNYDMWLGPAPKVPFTQNRWHYQWHWFWDYGGGDMVNDGIHQVDQVRWGLGVGMPKSVSAAGGQLFYDDDHETPDTQMVTFVYDDCYLIYEMRLWTDYPLEGHDNGVVFYGDNGTVDIGRKGAFVRLKDEEPRQLGEPVVFEHHPRNFLDCVKANDPSKLNAPMTEAVPSAVLCHLGNVATRVGHGFGWDAEHWSCGDDAAANALLTRTYREGYELPQV